MTSYTVLIVEDEPTFRRFLEFQLRNSERFRFEIEFAVAFGDLRELFLQEPLVSENREYKIAVDLLKAGADDYISKSDLLSPYMLEKTIVSVLQKREYRTKNSELEISAQRLDAIQTIIHTIDHELNNPLAIIKLCSEIINSSHPLRTDDYKDLTQRILSSMERVTQVIHKLNHFDEESVSKSVMGPKVYALSEVA